MITQNVISFRENFHTNDFPVEAVYYQHVGGGHCDHTSRTIHSLEELHDFQYELVLGIPQLPKAKIPCLPERASLHRTGGQSMMIGF